MKSPYEGVPQERWLEVTRSLVEKHPLSTDEIVEVVLLSWNEIFQSGIGSKPFKIGVDIFPQPQILSFMLHELVALEFQQRRPKEWRRDQAKDEKDLVYLPDVLYSTEIKASSHRNQVFGNRSYAQPREKGGKSKEGYYITINFEGFSEGNQRASIRLVRFGWIDHFDWIAQAAATGQQARLRQEAYDQKLLVIFGNP